MIDERARLGLSVGDERLARDPRQELVRLLHVRDRVDAQPLVEEAADLGAEELVFGMAHRGRLNTLAHVLCKPYEMILSEFEGHGLEQDEGDGDVKYHLGYSQDRITRTGRKIHVSMSFNPSHLELVNPVVEGIVRAKQYAFADNSRTRVVPVAVEGAARD